MTRRLGAVTAAVSALVCVRTALACDPLAPHVGDTWSDAIAATATTKADEIAALEQYMFTLKGKDADRVGIRTDGLLIIQNGQIIYERYARGFTATNKHLAWSVTKSLMHALVGIATQHGLSVTDSICQYFPKLPKSACDVQVQHLMDMGSGLYWNEVYENESNQASSVLAMLYGEGHRDMATFVATQGTKYAPGDTWYYSTGDATLLGAVLDAAMQPGLGKYWQWSELFEKIGITDTTLERDRLNHSVGGSDWWVTPRDMARFGYLYLHDGCWNGAQLLPAGWSADAATLASGMQAGHARERNDGDVYGHLWWLNTPAPTVGQIKPPMPDVPTDVYYADGHWGQLIYVVPSKQMVIVRTGDDRDEPALNQNTFVKLAIAVGH